MFVVGDWMSPGRTLWEFAKLEWRSVDGAEDAEEILIRAERAFASLLAELSNAAILLPDGRIVHVEVSFLRQVITVTPFCHRMFNQVSGEVGQTTYDYEAAVTEMRRILKYGTRWLFPALAVLGAAIFMAGLFMKSHGMLPSFLALCVFTFLSLPYAFARGVRAQAREMCGPYKGGHLLIDPIAFKEFASTRYGLDAFGADDHDGRNDLTHLSRLRGSPEEEMCALAIVDAVDNAQLSGSRLTRDQARERFVSTVSSGRAFNRAWEVARSLRPELGAGGRPKRNP